MDEDQAHKGVYTLERAADINDAAKKLGIKVKVEGTVGHTFVGPRGDLVTVPSGSEYLRIGEERQDLSALWAAIRAAKENRT